MSPIARVEELPRREVLQTLARRYHHLQNEHKRSGLESGVRRRIEEQLLDVRERFDRLLEDWVPDSELRQAWREHLHNRVAAPAGPATIRPLVFRGRSEAGAVVEVRGKGGHELLADGLIDTNAALTRRGRRALSRRE